jgi:predicted XRE-type DNA-binding protein
MVAGKLHRVRKGHAKGFVEMPPVALGPVRRPARLAIMLALAHKIQQTIDSVGVRDRAEVARRLGLTRARVTQLLDLTLLAPEIQEQILFVESVDGIEPMSERAVRIVTSARSWVEQRRVHARKGRIEAIALWTGVFVTR